MPRVKNILSYYNNENIGIKTNLYRILMHGKLANTGHIIILPVDQGFEHGPVRSFSPNPEAYDPEYHYNLAIESGMSAYTAPLGFLTSGADKFVGQIPIILKLNQGNSLGSSKIPDQAITATVKDALQLGCVGVGITIYPGSNKFLEMLEEAREIISEAKSYGLVVVIWSYPRGDGITKDGETAIDIISYAAHIAALIGAHIIKVKLPSNTIEQEEARKNIELYKIDTSTLVSRIRYIMTSCFNNKKLVVFSGGASKSEKELLEEVRSIKNAGGSGSIIGRNSFQRTKNESLKLLNNICKIYLEDY